MIKAGLYQEEIVRLRREMNDEDFDIEEWADRHSVTPELVKNFCYDLSGQREKDLEEISKQSGRQLSKEEVEKLPKAKQSTEGIGREVPRPKRRPNSAK